MKIITIASLLLFTGCHICNVSGEPGLTYNRYISIISESGVHSSIYMIIPVLDEDEYRQAIITNTQLFYQFYKPSYGEHMSFKEYINQLYNNIISIGIEDIKEEYILLKENGTIDKEFSAEGLEYLLKKYLHKRSQGVYRLETSLPEQDLYSLINVCFQNNIFVSFDCYSGFYMFRKLSSFKGD